MNMGEMGGGGGGEEGAAGWTKGTQGGGERDSQPSVGCLVLLMSSLTMPLLYTGGQYRHIRFKS